MGVLTEVTSALAGTLMQASGLPVSPVFAAGAGADCCVYSVGPGAPAGLRSGALMKVPVTVRISCRRYADLCTVAARISDAVAPSGNTPPAWDTSGRVTAALPMDGTLSVREFDAEFYQMDLKFEIYVARRLNDAIQ